MTVTISGPNGRQRADDDVRKGVLARAVDDEVIVGGRIEAQGDVGATIHSRRPYGPVRNLLLIVGTAGLWGIATLVMYWANRWLKFIVPREAYGKRFRGYAAYHLVNLALTAVTVGLWGLLLRVMYRVGRSDEQDAALSVDESGEVVRRAAV